MHTQEYICMASAFSDVSGSKTVMATVKLVPGFNYFHPKFSSTTHDFAIADAWLSCHAVSTWIWDGDMKSGSVTEAIIFIYIFLTVRQVMSLVVDHVLKEEMACATISLNQ